MTLELQKVNLYTPQQRDFAKEVIENARESGLSPQDATLAIGMALAWMYLGSDPEKGNREAQLFAIDQLTHKIVNDWHGVPTPQEGSA